MKVLLIAAALAALASPAFAWTHGTDNGSAPPAGYGFVIDPISHSYMIDPISGNRLIAKL